MGAVAGLSFPGITTCVPSRDAAPPGDGFPEKEAEKRHIPEGVFGSQIQPCLNGDFHLLKLTYSLFLFQTVGAVFLLCVA